MCGMNIGMIINHRDVAKEHIVKNVKTLWLPDPSVIKS